MYSLDILIAEGLQLTTRIFSGVSVASIVGTLGEGALKGCAGFLFKNSYDVFNKLMNPTKDLFDPLVTYDEIKKFDKDSDQASYFCLVRDCFVSSFECLQALFLKENPSSNKDFVKSVFSQKIEFYHSDEFREVYKKHIMETNKIEYSNNISQYYEELLKTDYIASATPQDIKSKIIDSITSFINFVKPNAWKSQLREVNIENIQEFIDEYFEAYYKMNMLQLLQNKKYNGLLISYQMLLLKKMNIGMKEGFSCLEGILAETRSILEGTYAVIGGFMEEISIQLNEIKSELTEVNKGVNEANEKLDKVDSKAGNIYHDTQEILAILKQSSISDDTAKIKEYIEKIVNTKDELVLAVILNEIVKYFSDDNFILKNLIAKYSVNWYDKKYAKNSEIEQIIESNIISKIKTGSDIDSNLVRRINGEIVGSMVGLVRNEYQKLSQAIAKKEGKNLITIDNFISYSKCFIQATLELFIYALLSDLWQSIDPANNTNYRKTELNEEERKTVRDALNNLRKDDIRIKSQDLKLLLKVFRAVGLRIPIIELGALQEEDFAIIEDICNDIQSYYDKMAEHKIYLSCFIEDRLSQFLEIFYFICDYEISSLQKLEIRRKYIYHNPSYIYSVKGFGKKSELKYSNEEFDSDCILIYKKSNIADKVNLYPFIIDLDVISYKRSENPVIYWFKGVYEKREDNERINYIKYISKYEDNEDNILEINSIDTNIKSSKIIDNELIAKLNKNLLYETIIDIFEYFKK